MKQKQIKVPQITPVSNKGPRNAFDLSQRNLFHAPVGALLPVHSLELMPGDHVSMKITDFMRVMPCNSAAFIDCKGSYETFFVPFSQLWKPWNQFITSMQDYNSTLLANKNMISGSAVPPYLLPTADLAQFGKYINETMQAGITDEFGYKLSYGFNRLVDLLGYGKMYKSDGSKLWDAVNSPYPSVVTINLFRFLAYQKIYQDVYRNTQYEKFDVGSFNIDDFNSGLNSLTDDDRLRRMFSLRYRNYGLDLLSNIRPSVLVDAYSAQSVSALQPNVYQTWGEAFPNVVNDAGSVPQNGTVDNKIDDVIMSHIDASGDFSIRSLRAAFAYQNLLDTMGRAPKTYKDQMKAIFGVDVPMGMEGKVQYVGGVDSSFQFGDVTNTAISASDTTASSPYNNGLGASVVKGVASGSGYMEFDAPIHGVLMTIYSVIPQNQYDSTRLDPFNQKKTRSDYFLPQYDHLGMQPLYQSAVTMRNSSLVGSTKVNQSLTRALGWQPRYSEYKTAIDINHGQFTDDGPLKFYTSDRSRGTTQQDWTWLTDLHLRDLKINPNIFDSVFKVAYNGKETTDPFYGSVQFNITKVSNMDRQSMPNV